MSDAATVANSQDIVVDEVFPHAPEVVWKTLSTPELMGRWLSMTSVGFEATSGRRFTYPTPPAGDWDRVLRRELPAVIVNERLVYTWKGGHEANVGYGSRLETVVTWTLTKIEGGTRLRLVHSGFRPQNDTAFRNMSAGWTKVLEKIEAIAAEQN